MNHKTKILVLLVLALLIVAGCIPRTGAGPTEPAASPTGPAPAEQVSTLDELIAGLEAGGATVEMGDPLMDSFFPVEGQIVEVNGAPLTVWEFPDEAAREAAQATISGGGFIIGTTAVDWIDLPHFFAQGRLIVLYVGQDQAIIDLLSGLLGDSINPQTQGGPATVDQEPFARAAKAFLAQELGIPEDDIVFMAAEAVEWTDGCLGLGGPAESCLLAITPGYRVTLEARGESYTLRTDEPGDQVRLEP